jgi:hypothetical protein
MPLFILTFQEQIRKNAPKWPKEMTICTNDYQAQEGIKLPVWLKKKYTQH